MNAQNRTTTFEHIILEALKVGGTQDFPPFNIFQAAIGDLAGDYPKEKNFLLRIADERYYGLCEKAADGLRAGNTSGMNAAAQYLQDKYMVDNGWSKYITRAMAQAFAEHKYGVKVAASAEPAGKRKDSASKPASAPKTARTPKPDNKPKPARAPKPASAPKPATTPQKKSKKPMIIGVAAVIVLAVVCLLVGRPGGTGTSSDSSTFTEEGVAITLPGTYYEHYYYFPSSDNGDSVMLVIEENSCDGDSLEACWQQETERIKEDDENSIIYSDETEIDGEACYSTSYRYDEGPVAELFMPQGEQNYVEISMWGEAEGVFDSLMREAHYTEDQDDTSDYINKCGIALPNILGWEMTDCSYDSQDGHLIVDRTSSTAESDYGLNEVYRNDLDYVSEESEYTVLDQGETEIDGTEGKWFDYEMDFGSGEKSYCYSLYFQSKSNIVHLEYRFDKTGDHSSEIQEINDNIHFEDE